jgi:hypothetical protein
MLNQPIDWLLLRLVKGLILLQLLASLAGAGSPVFAQSQPARPFNMVTLGDSIIWGQGLPESMKFRRLVANWLQSQYGTSRKVVQWTTHAHSGAVTGWGLYPTETCPSPQNCNDPDIWYAMHPSSGYGPGYPYPGEVPFGYPSISFQIGMTVNDLKLKGVDPANVDLVLFDGCINDLSATNIVNPSLVETNLLQGEVANGPNWVRTKTNELCVSHAQSLLPQVMTQFPNAIVIMTGYFPIVSGNTDLLKLAEYLTVLGLAGGAGPPAAGIVGGPGAALDYLVGVPAAAVPVAAALRAALTDRSQAFATTAFNGLTALVTQQNQGLTAPRVALAWPSFSDDNAYAAPNSYLFLLEDYLGDEIRGSKGQAPPGDWNTPEGVAYYRAEECTIAHPSDPTCYAALVGHPNPKGAQAYAQAIISQLQGVFWTKLAIPKLPQLSAAASITGQSPLTVALTITDAASKVPVLGMQVWVQDGFGRAQSSGTTAADGTVRLSFTPCPQSYFGPHLLPSSVPSPACPIYGTVAKYGMLNSWTPALAATASVTTANALSVSVSDPLTKTNVAGATVGVLDGQGHMLVSGTTAVNGLATLSLAACSQGYLNPCNANVVVSKVGYLSCSFAVPSAGQGGNCQYSPYAGATPLPSMAGVVALAPNNITAVRPNAGLTAQQLQVQLPALSASVCPTADGRTCSSLPKLPRGQETTTPLRAIVSVTSNGRPVAGASVGVDGGTGGVTGAAGQVVVTYNLFLYSPRQEQGPGGPDTDPRGKPIHALGNANTATLRVPGATASKAGFQPADVSLPRPLVR